MTSFKRSLIIAGILTATAGIAAAQGVGRGKDKHDRGVAARYEKLAPFDANKDGKLDAAELAKLEADRKAERARRIARFDTNKDGSLDETERALARKARIADVFVQLDTDKNGALSKAEFEAGAQKLMKHRGGKGMRQGRMGQGPKRGKGHMGQGRGHGHGQGQGQGKGAQGQRGNGPQR